ncbi:hypothetical protein [Aeromicrobium massiliense]|uniref:hypothetical protein n=1 Tax=Aeromicrobium massiliense TaxID=1464554 RepID=UPI0005783CB4|nr:hypothetical protein [Aeromicrobium massiliense]
MRLPQVLEVVVFGRGAAALDLGEDPALVAEVEVEVRPGLGDELVLRAQHDLLVEAELTEQDRRDECLDFATLGVVHVSDLDLAGAQTEPGLHALGHAVDEREIVLVLGTEA